MFEQEIEDLQQIIKDNTIGNTPEIALKTILESNIPSNVKSFFKAEVELLLFIEREKEMRSTKFNYQQADIRMLQEQIDILLVYHYTFSQKEFFEACDRCVHFLFNFLCRPQWTMGNFLFEDKDRISTSELAYKFRFCSDYSYYWLILEKYLTSKNIQEFSKDETNQLLQKIDREVIRENSALELAKMTEPFFNFVYYIQSNGFHNGSKGIPIKALSYFFEDKKINSVSEFLHKQRDSGKSILQFDELENILKDNFFKKGSYLEEDAFQISKSIQQQPIAEKLMIPEKDKLAIIKLIFGNDESKYLITIESILSSQTWEDAALSLDHYFTMNDIEPFSREAIVLTNSLQSYFSNQQKKDGFN